MLLCVTAVLLSSCLLKPFSRYILSSSCDKMFLVFIWAHLIYEKREALLYTKIKESAGFENKTESYDQVEFLCAFLLSEKKGNITLSLP